MKEPHRPLVSIVMPSLNQAAYLDTALNSVLSQSYRNIELIVADGGSTDGSLDVLELWQAKDHRLRLITGPDTGPAQAVNKALHRTRGTVIGWLNSDDFYASYAVERAVSALHGAPNYVMVYGQGQHTDSAGIPIGLYPTSPPSTPIDAFQDGCFICQPTVFFRRTLFLLLGNLDERLKTAFDFDYWLRAFKSFPERIGFVDAVQAYSRLHDDCITLRMRRTVILEGMRVLAAHLGSAPPHWLTSHLSAMSDPVRETEEKLVDYAESLMNDAAAYLKPTDLAAVRQLISKRPSA